MISLLAGGGDEGAAGMETAGLVCGHVNEHLRWCKLRNLRPSTIQQRRYVFGRLRRIVGGCPLGHTHLELLGFLDRGLSAEGQACELSHLRSFYRWAGAESMIPLDPTARLVRPKLPRRLPRPMPDDDLADAIDDAPDRIRLALMLAAYAGLRACEIAQLRGEHVLRGQQPPILIVAEGKGGGQSSVPLHPALVNEFARWPRRGPVFPRLDGTALPVKAHLVSHTVNTYLHARGVAHTLHTARHWFGTNTYRSTGRDLRATQELMRHRSPTATSIYTYVDPGGLSGAVNALSMPGRRLAM